MSTELKTMASDNAKIYIGNIVTGNTKHDGPLVTNEALVVKDDTIIARGEPEHISERYSGDVIKLAETEFLAPGYIDA